MAKDERAVYGASATLGNVAPERPPVPDPEETDAYEGTSSGSRLLGKPPRGNQGRMGF